MEFSRGQRVEILQEDEGFEGSYYPAVVISQVKEKTYIVQYSTLYDDSRDRPLREFRKESEIRPTPKEIPVQEFDRRVRVDAYHNDGWWVGQIKSVSKGSEKKYMVYFSNSKEEIEFEFEDLRLHQEYSRGSWTTPKTRGRPFSSREKAKQNCSQTRSRLKTEDLED